MGPKPQPATRGIYLFPRALHVDDGKSWGLSLLHPHTRLDPRDKQASGPSTNPLSVSVAHAFDIRHGAGVPNAMGNPGIKACSALLVKSLKQRVFMDGSGYVAVKSVFSVVCAPRCVARVFPTCLQIAVDAADINFP